MVFTHGGVRATVRRNLRPARPTAVLTIDGAEKIVGDEKVTAKIEDLLGITTDIINDIVIVAQNDLFGFLDKTPAKRAAQFQKLFHTEKAAVVYKAIGDQIGTLKIPSVGVDLDALRMQVQQSRDAVRQHEATLVAMAEYDHIKEQIAANTAVVHDYDTLEQLRGRHGRLQEQMQARGNICNTVREERASCAAELQSIEEAKLQNAEPAQAAEIVLRQLDEWRRSNAARQRQLDIINAASLQLAALTQPTKPPGYSEDPSVLRPEYDKLHAEIGTLFTFIQSFNDDVGECPTCGTEAASLQPKLVEANIRLPIAEELRDNNATRYNASTQYNLEKSEFDRQFTLFTDRQQQAQRAFADMPEEKNTEVDEAELQRKISSQTTMADGIAEYKKILAQHDQELAKADGATSAMTTQLDGLATAIAELPAYSAEQRYEADRNVVGWERVSVQRREADMHMTAAVTSLHQGEQQLEQAERVEVEARLLRDWTNHGLAMREVVHKDGAPRFVAHRNLQLLQGGMNEFLEMFDTDYRVTANEGLSFVASFNSGSKQPAERLSEGQKVVLALAFRLALNRMFAENVGALYLDEPTAYLDEHHIRGFEPVLAQLREFSASRGLQCMIVTHERDLAPLFDSVIQL
jgi:DNA repair exonuclease SbcCD ATPase subunit